MGYTSGSDIRREMYTNKTTCITVRNLEINPCTCASDRVYFFLHCNHTEGKGAISLLLPELIFIHIQFGLNHNVILSHGQDSDKFKWANMPVKNIFQVA